MTTEKRHFTNAAILAAAVSLAVVATVATGQDRTVEANLNVNDTVTGERIQDLKLQAASRPTWEYPASAAYRCQFGFSSPDPSRSGGNQVTGLFIPQNQETKQVHGTYSAIFPNGLSVEPYNFALSNPRPDTVYGGTFWDYDTDTNKKCNIRVYPGGRRVDFSECPNDAWMFCHAMDW